MANLIQKQFSERLTQIMDERDVSITRLGSEMKVSYEAVRRWRDGRGMPRFEKIERIAEILNVTPKWLLFGDDDKKQDDVSNTDSLRLVSAVSNQASQDRHRWPFKIISEEQWFSYSEVDRAQAEGILIGITSQFVKIDKQRKEA